MNHHVFVHRHRVRYADCTLGNHIYYARYLDLLEAARGEMFRQLGQTFLRWQEEGFLFPVLEVHLRYHRPARYDDELDIALWLTRLDRVRLNFGCSIRNQRTEMVLEGETCHVCTSLEEKPRRLPPELVSALQPYIRSGEEESADT
jgi:acyl-CoA thioester hydrolase